MIVNKKVRDRYLDNLCSRYSSIVNILTGRQAIANDARHGVKATHSCWSAEKLEGSVIVDALDLNLAIDDLSAILKEIKKLAK